MGKDNELLQAVKDQDIVTLHKLLHKLRGSKSSELILSFMLGALLYEKCDPKIAQLCCQFSSANSGLYIGEVYHLSINT